MNRRMVLQITGQTVMMEGALMVLPLVVSFIYREDCWKAFLVTILIALGIGFLLSVFAKPKDTSIYTREGFVIVSLAWLIFSLIGALPFVITGEIPNFVDAFFETVSGFTTTGASIVPNVEVMSHGVLFWRSLTHWIGGMGILVFVVMLGTKADNNSLHIFRAEMPGPTVDKLVPRAKDTARALYTMYFALTLLEIILLLCGGMNLFESIVHTFGTAGTGGFGVKADSIGGYSPYLQWVVTVFMVVFGVNFNLYFLMFRGKLKEALSSEELRTYLIIVLVSTALITANVYHMFDSFSEALRHSAFQVATIISTTGYATTDFDLWPEFSKAILLTLMFIGACAGSTAGGLKVSRIVVLFKTVGVEVRRLIRPRSVNAVRLDGRTVPDETVNGVTRYLVIFVLLFVLIFLLVGLDSPDLETAFSATAACINNIGPGFSAVGPTLNYAGYSWFSKIMLSFAMLLGRLEIYPLVISLSFLSKRQ